MKTKKRARAGILGAFAAALLCIATAHAGPTYDLQLHQSTATLKIAGSISVAASSATGSTFTITLNGQTGRVTAVKFNGDGSELTGLSAGHVIENAGSSVPFRSSMNFTGAGVTVTDSGGKTVVNIPGGGSGSGGHAIQDEGVDVVFRATMNFVGNGVVVTDIGGKTVVNISSGAVTDAIRSTHTTLGVLTTNSATWASVPGSTLTLVMDISNFIETELSCNIECVSNTQCGVAFAYMVDGAFIDGITASTSTGIMFLETPATITGSPISLQIDHKSRTKLSPGTHNLSLLWASVGGVDVRMGRGMGGCGLRYKEAPEQFNAGAAATVSGAVNMGSQTQASLQALTCSVRPCLVHGNFGIYDLWTATGTLPGQWMNTRTGTGP